MLIDQPYVRNSRRRLEFACLARKIFSRKQDFKRLQFSRPFLLAHESSTDAGSVAAEAVSSNCEGGLS